MRYVAHDTARRGGASEEPLMAVLVHSGVPLGMKLNDEEELNDQNPKSKRKTLLENFWYIMIHSRTFFQTFFIVIVAMFKPLPRLSGNSTLELRQDPFPTAAARMQSELEEKLPELPWATAEVW